MEVCPSRFSAEDAAPEAVLDLAAGVDPAEVFDSAVGADLAGDAAVRRSDMEDIDRRKDAEHCRSADNTVLADYCMGFDLRATCSRCFADPDHHIDRFDRRRRAANFYRCS